MPVAFTLAQLPFIAAVLGIGHLLRDRAPLVSNLGTTLAVIGAFGHSVYGGITMVQVTMAADEANRPVHAETLTQVESGPAVAFMAMGLLGTVLGILLLAIGLWRAHVAPRWAGPVLGAFLVIEFAGSAISDWASLVSVVLYVAAFTGLAVTIWRGPTEITAITDLSELCTPSMTYPDPRYLDETGASTSGEFGLPVGHGGGALRTGCALPQDHQV